MKKLTDATLLHLMTDDYQTLNYDGKKLPKNHSDYLTKNSKLKRNSDILPGSVEKVAQARRKTAIMVRFDSAQYRSHVSAFGHTPKQGKLSICLTCW